MASALSLPSADMAMVRHLLVELPDVNNTGQSVGADIGLWIEPDGVINGCNIRRFVGDEVLAAQFCQALLGFRVARPLGVGGREVRGYTELTFTAFPDQKLAERSRLIRRLNELRAGSPEAVLLQSLVKDAKKAKDLHLLAEVDADGTVVACARATKKLKESLATEACGNLMGRSLDHFEAAPRVRYVRSFGSLTG